MIDCGSRRGALRHRALAARIRRVGLVAKRSVTLLELFTVMGKEKGARRQLSRLVSTMCAVKIYSRLHAAE